jgi:hypothetical protein
MRLVYNISERTSHSELPASRKGQPCVFNEITGAATVGPFQRLETESRGFALLTYRHTARRIFRQHVEACPGMSRGTEENYANPQSG